MWCCLSGNRQERSRSLLSCPLTLSTMQAHKCISDDAYSIDLQMFPTSFLYGEPCLVSSLFEKSSALIVFVLFLCCIVQTPDYVGISKYIHGLFHHPHPHFFFGGVLTFNIVFMWNTYHFCLRTCVCLPRLSSKSIALFIYVFVAFLFLFAALFAERIIVCPLFGSETCIVRYFSPKIFLIPYEFLFYVGQWKTCFFFFFNCAFFNILFSF